jgi:ADP-heptose:LPS heptosyltransferase
VELVEGVHKLAVLRANAIGDYLVSLPAIQALRTAYPAAELVLLGADWHAGFLAGRPGPVDRYLPVPPTVGVGDDRPPAPPAAVDRFFARMRAERFDLAVQLQGVPPFQPVPAPAWGPGDRRVADARRPTP